MDPEEFHSGNILLHHLVFFQAKELGYEDVTDEMNIAQREQFVSVALNAMKAAIGDYIALDWEFRDRKRTV